MTETGFALVRYADDFVILCKTREDAERALDMVQRWVAENELTLHPTKTKIVDARTEGFEFLGYHFRNKLRLPRQKSLTKFKDTVRDKTKRTNGTVPFLCSRLFATRKRAETPPRRFDTIVDKTTEIEYITLRSG